MEVDDRDVDGHVRTELMRRMTAPTGRHVEMAPEAHHVWGPTSTPSRCTACFGLSVSLAARLPVFHVETIT